MPNSSDHEDERVSLLEEGQAPLGLTFPHSSRNIVIALELVWGAIMGVAVPGAFDAFGPDIHVFYYIAGLAGVGLIAGTSLYTSIKKLREERRLEAELVENTQVADPHQTILDYDNVITNILRQKDQITELVSEAKKSHREPDSHRNTDPRVKLKGWINDLYHAVSICGRIKPDNTLPLSDTNHLIEMSKKNSAIVSSWNATLQDQEAESTLYKVVSFIITSALGLFVNLACAAYITKDILDINLAENVKSLASFVLDLNVTSGLILLSCVALSVLPAIAAVLRRNCDDHLGEVRAENNYFQDHSPKDQLESLNEYECVLVGRAQIEIEDELHQGLGLSSTSILSEALAVSPAVIGPLSAPPVAPVLSQEASPSPSPAPPPPPSPMLGPAMIFHESAPLPPPLVLPAPAKSPAAPKK